MGKNTEEITKIQRPEEMLQKKIKFFEDQKECLENYSIGIVIGLFLLLILIFSVFSLKIEFIHIDSNSIRLLWIVVILDIVGLVWIVGRYVQQLKRYKTCIIRLNALQLKISIKTSDSDKQISEEEVCKEVEEIVEEFCFGRNVGDYTENLPTDGSQQVIKD